ncbi:hypothetical protein Y043_6005 [Burkholderia pseudomallei MSHR2138]|nr:hypothetical protein Y043_6005 [Burkholderia pseudomallei MSHR2138]
MAYIDYIGHNNLVLDEMLACVIDVIYHECKNGATCSDIRRVEVESESNSLEVG